MITSGTDADPVIMTSKPSIDTPCGICKSKSLKYRAAEVLLAGNVTAAERLSKPAISLTDVNMAILAEATDIADGILRTDTDCSLPSIVIKQPFPFWLSNGFVKMTDKTTPIKHIVEVLNN